MSAGTPPVDLSIVVVAFSGPDLLRATLGSVALNHGELLIEVVVVTTGEIDRIGERLSAEFPAVAFVRSPANRGFAAANNLGIRGSRGRYVLLLNPDTLVPPGALAALVTWMDAHPHVGMAGPRLVQPDGATQPYSFGMAPTPLYLLRRLVSHRRGRYLHRWDGAAPLAVDWVAGTCMLVRRAALEAVGPLDERFFLYFEDVDWGLRLRRAGWGVCYLPQIAITHIGGASVGAAAATHYDRSLMLLYGKRYGAGAGFVVWLLLRVYRALQRRRRAP